MDEFINSFRESLETGFIDKELNSDFLYQPKLLVNSKKPRKKILTSLLQEFDTCESFFISVAFVTTSGVATIINTLEKLKQKNIKGKLVVSQYLNFTQPEALRKLLQFNNIELRIAIKEDAHSKGYLFKKTNHYNLIVGSSNLTQTALSSNKEWNLQVSAIENSSIINKVKIEFEKDFKNAIPVTKEYINEYEKIYNQKKILLPNTLKFEEINREVEPNTMQLSALQNLKNLRQKSKNKALIISATGTGKTYLAAFDAKSTNPKKLLFIVHRLNIAKKAMETFKKVFGNNKTMGIYSGQKREINKDFLFSTVQTISKLNHLKIFKKDHFDYIIIDETHRAGAKSYQNLINYFIPKFLLGMTATPERTDNIDIFKLFNHNIAYEIRLNDAMEEQMLCPFHYYGVSDLYIDNIEQDNVKVFNKLTSIERVNKIIEKSKFYGSDNGISRGLIFVSKKNEAIELSLKFNQKGIKTVALHGGSSNEERENAIKLLESNDESNRLEYIFTVDIFNEGIDIPKVNQIIMLRPTESAIIFVQQLGRGLRKLDSKSYLTVIDFIGNHNNNYLIPIALYGDTSFNKDKLRKLLSSGSNELPGVSTINFDEISKEKIFKSIDSANMSLIKDLKKDYSLLKYRLGRTPMMMDFIEQNSRDPYLYIKYSKSYFNFVLKIEPDLENTLSDKQIKLLELFSKEINNSKRVEESVILINLLEYSTLTINNFKNQIKNEYEYEVTEETIKSCLNNLNFKFIREKKKGKLLSANEIYSLDIIYTDKEKFIFSNEFESLLKNKQFRNYIYDSTKYSIDKYKKAFIGKKWNDGFILYNKYSRKDVFRILNIEINPVAQNVGGYLVSTDNSNCPIFANYEKHENISESTKYEDKFLNQRTFQYMSKSNRKITSNDVQSILGSNGFIRLPLFLKKSNDEGEEFYYMGDVNTSKNLAEQTTMKNDNGKLMSVVKFVFNLEFQVPDNLYNYIIDKNKITPLLSKKESSITIDKATYEIPFYDFYAAAGSFSEMQTDKDFTLINVPEYYNKEGYFACKVIGESMNRRIPNDSICIFKQPVIGGRNGKILLVEYYNKQDEDLKSHFTVKTYSSSKVTSEEGWSHEKIILKPNSFDMSYKNIIITKEDVQDNYFNIVGEFVGILEE